MTIDLRLTTGSSMRKGLGYSPVEWFFLEAPEHAGKGSTVRARDGRTYVRFPVGFPGRVILRDPDHLLQPHAGIRLMKAVSQALQGVTGPGGPSCLPASGNPLVFINVVRHAPHEARSVALYRPGKSDDGDLDVWNVSIEARWLERSGDSALRLRRSLDVIFGSPTAGSGEKASFGRKRVSGGPPRGKSKVLLFRNEFSEYHRNPASDQITGATHVLLTSLERASCRGQNPPPRRKPGSRRAHPPVRAAGWRRCGCVPCPAAPPSPDQKSVE